MFALLALIDVATDEENDCVNVFNADNVVSTDADFASNEFSLRAWEPLSVDNSLSLWLIEAEAAKNEDDTAVYLGISAVCPACCVSEPVIMGLSKIISPFYLSINIL